MNCGEVGHLIGRCPLPKIDPVSKAASDLSKLKKPRLRKVLPAHNPPDHKIKPPSDVGSRVGYSSPYLPDNINDILTLEFVLEWLKENHPEIECSKCESRRLSDKLRKRKERSK